MGSALRSLRDRSGPHRGRDLPQTRALLQSENGLLGIGPYPAAGEADPDLINAGKETVTAVPGAAYFDSAESFSMIRGGHIDLAVLGGMESPRRATSPTGWCPARWSRRWAGRWTWCTAPSASWWVMEHLTRAGESRVKRTCTLPLTGVGVVHRLITDLAVFDFTPPVEMVLVETQPGVTVGDVEKATEARFAVRESLGSWLPGH